MICGVVMTAKADYLMMWVNLIEVTDSQCDVNVCCFVVV